MSDTVQFTIRNCTMLILGILCVVLTSPCQGGENAQPKEGKTVDPPLSADTPAAYAGLPVFGSIEWRVEHLPWVGEGPNEGVSGMGMVEVDGMIYLVGGFIPGGDETDDEASRRTSRWTWRFDPESGGWKRLPDAPGRREYVRAVAADHALYLVGGACQYKGKVPWYRAHGECFKLELSVQAPVWSLHSRLNVPRTHTAVGRIGQSLIVVGGNEYDSAEKGYSRNTIRGTTEVFDLTEPGGGWQVRTAIPGAPRGWTASVGTNDALYVFGGLTWNESNTTAGVRETLKYNPASDTWQQLAPPPLAVSGWEGALYDGRYVILAGGVDRGKAPDASIVWSDLVWAYDTQEDGWLQVNGVLPPGAVFNDPGVVIIGDTIYIAGAEGPFGSHYDYFLVGEIQAE